HGQRREADVDAVDVAQNIGHHRERQQPYVDFAQRRFFDCRDVHLFPPLIAAADAATPRRSYPPRHRASISTTPLQSTYSVEAWLVSRFRSSSGFAARSVRTSESKGH